MDPIDPFEVLRAHLRHEPATTARDSPDELIERIVREPVRATRIERARRRARRPRAPARPDARRAVDRRPEL